MTLIDLCVVLLNSLDSDKTILIICSAASSILAAGQVSPDLFLLTLIDLWLVLLNSLDSDKRILIYLFHYFFNACCGSHQSRSISVDFDRSVVGSP